jgi:hypothetical protein
MGLLVYIKSRNVRRGEKIGMEKFKIIKEEWDKQENLIDILNK